MELDELNMEGKRNPYTARMLTLAPGMNTGLIQKGQCCLWVLNQWRGMTERLKDPLGSKHMTWP